MPCLAFCERYSHHAYRELILAREQTLGSRTRDEDGHAREKLGLRDGETLVDGVSRVVENLGDWVRASYAEETLRPLEAYFGSHEPRLDDGVLNRTLRPYLPTLFALAARYCVTNGHQMHAAEDEQNEQGVNVQHEGLSLLLRVKKSSLSGILSFGDIAPMTWTFADATAFVDFLDIVELATAVEPRFGACSVRPWSVHMADADFAFSDGSKTFYFSAAALTKIRALVDKVRATSAVAQTLDAARFVTGAI